MYSQRRDSPGGAAHGKTYSPRLQRPRSFPYRSDEQTSDTWAAPYLQSPDPSGGTANRSPTKAAWRPSGSPPQSFPASKRGSISSSPRPYANRSPSRTKVSSGVGTPLSTCSSNSEVEEFRKRIGINGSSSREPSVEARHSSPRTTTPVGRSRTYEYESPRGRQDDTTRYSSPRPVTPTSSQRNSVGRDDSPLHKQVEQWQARLSQTESAKEKAQVELIKRDHQLSQLERRVAELQATLDAERARHHAQEFNADKIRKNCEAEFQRQLDSFRQRDVLKPQSVRETESDKLTIVKLETMLANIERQMEEERKNSLANENALRQSLDSQIQANRQLRQQQEEEKASHARELESLKAQLQHKDDEIKRLAERKPLTPPTNHLSDPAIEEAVAVLRSAPTEKRKRGLSALRKAVREDAAQEEGTRQMLRQIADLQRELAEQKTQSEREIEELREELDSCRRRGPSNPPSNVSTFDQVQMEAKVARLEDEVKELERQAEELRAQAAGSTAKKTPPPSVPTNASAPAAVAETSPRLSAQPPPAKPQVNQQSLEEEGGSEGSLDAKDVSKEEGAALTVLSFLLFGAGLLFITVLLAFSAIEMATGTPILTEHLVPLTQARAAEALAVWESRWWCTNIELALAVVAVMWFLGIQLGGVASWSASCAVLLLLGVVISLVLIEFAAEVPISDALRQHVDLRVPQYKADFDTYTADRTAKLQAVYDYVVDLLMRLYENGAMLMGDAAEAVKGYTNDLVEYFS